MAEDQIDVKVKGDSSGFDKEAKKAENSIKGVIGKIGDLKASTVVAFVAIKSLISGIIGAASSILSSAAALEEVNTQYKVLTGSAESAGAALKQLQAFSAKTPFQFEEVADAGRILLSFGFTVDSLTERLQRLGDVAAATNSDFKEVSLIYGQVAAAGKLTGEKLLQLQERGINLGPALAKSLGVAETAVRGLITQGKVDFKTFEAAFNSLSDKGGIAFGGLVEKSSTLNGKLSTMKDNFVIAAQNIGAIFLPTAKKVVDALTDIAAGIADLFRDTAAQDMAGELVDAIMVREDSIKALQKEQEQAKEGSIYYNLLAGSIATERKELEKLNIALDKIAGAQLKRKQEAPEDVAAAEIAKKQLEAEKLYQLERGNMIDSFNQKNNLNNATSEEERLAMLLENQQIEADLKEVARADELAAKGEFENASAALTEIAVQREIAAIQGRTKAKADADAKEKAAEEARRALLQSSYAQIASLQQSSNKSLIAVGKAAGIANVIISTNVGAAKALELGPIVGPILAGAIYAAGAVNAANIAGVQGFENGGVIGGMQGATAGSDNRMATVRDGEMVLNAGQQETLFNAIQSGSLGGNTQVVIQVNDQRFADAFEAQIVQRRKLGTSRI